jgi:hypothetical protein
MSQAVPLAWRASLRRLTLTVDKARDDAAEAEMMKGALLLLPSLTHLAGVPSSMSYWLGLLAAAEAGGLKHLTNISGACDDPLPNAPTLLLAAWLKRRVESGATPFRTAGVKTGATVVRKLIRGIGLEDILQMD